MMYLIYALSSLFLGLSFARWHYDAAIDGRDGPSLFWGVMTILAGISFIGNLGVAIWG